MSWSFNDELPTDRDKVRLKIGDTNTDDQLLSNETIDALLDEHSDDVMLSTISCIRAIIAKFSRNLSRGAIGMSADLTVQVAHYQQLLADLIRANRGNSDARYKGSFSYDRQETIEDDSDFKRPAFKSGQWDHPGTADSSDPNSDKFG